MPKTNTIFLPTMTYNKLITTQTPSLLISLSLPPSRHPRFSTMRASNYYIFLLISAILAVRVSPSSSTTLDFLPLESSSSSECRGSIAECLMDEELEMDSESNRRILATRRYVSYGALRRNTVPCSRRGASYYNCRAGAQANPYTRGCSRITRCRG